MSSMPPNSASRRPEGSWPPPEDEDFKIVPPPGVSSPASSPVSSPVSRQVYAPPAPAAPQYAPAPPPPRPAPAPMVAPATVRAPPRAATGTPNRQRLFLGIGAAVVLLAAFGFFLLYQVLNNGTATQASGSPLQVAATAVANEQWPAALPGCKALFANPTVEPGSNKLLAQTYYGCGRYLVRPEAPDVKTALDYFRKANELQPNDSDTQHQMDLAQRYIAADATMRKPDMGGYIGQLEWFTKQPEFDKVPYADTPARLYHAYIDSGNGYIQIPACDLARHRFEQAVAVKFVVDKAEAQRHIDEALKICK